MSKTKEKIKSEIAVCDLCGKKRVGIKEGEGKKSFTCWYCLEFDKLMME